MKASRRGGAGRIASFSQALAQIPRNIWAVTLTSFLTDISSEMLLNLLPLYLANVLGLRTGLIGLIEGFALTTSSLLKVFSGWLSDRSGQRKTLAAVGYALSAIAKPFLFLANGWGDVLAVRLADRVGKGIRTAPRDALIADSVSTANRGLAFGLHRAGDTAGAAIGLSIALLVVWLSQGVDLSLSRETFQTLALISAIPAFLAVIVLTVGVREAIPVRSLAKRATKPRGRLGAGFKRYLLVTLLFTLGNSSDAFIILRAQERGLTVVGVLGMLITFNVVYALISGPSGAFADRFGKRRLIVAGWLAYAVIYLGFALFGQAWQIWLLFGVYGVYYGMTEGVGRAMVADLVGAEVRGSAFGLYNSVIGLAALPASLIAGLLWQGVGPWPGFGPAAPFLFGGLLALAAAILFALSNLPVPEPN